MRVPFLAQRHVARPHPGPSPSGKIIAFSTESVEESLIEFHGVACAMLRRIPGRAVQCFRFHRRSMRSFRAFSFRAFSFRDFGLGACLDGESGQLADPGQGPAQAWHAAAASTDPNDLCRRCNILPEGEPGEGGRLAPAARLMSSHSKLMATALFAPVRANGSGRLGEPGQLGQRNAVAILPQSPYPYALPPLAFALVGLWAFSYSPASCKIQEGAQHAPTFTPRLPQVVDS